MKTIFVLDEHRVYDSLKLAYPNSEQLPHKSRVLIGNNKLFFQKTEVKFEKGKQYVLNSPINSYECWQALIGGHDIVLVEEYYDKGLLKNLLALSLLAPFRGKTFLSQTKRTHGFLLKHGFNSFLIPPESKEQNGAQKREFYLFVGKMVESKNPFFVLELAKLMPKEHFIMIGQGELFDEAVGKATGNVSFIPEVIPHDRLLDEYFCRAKALIHPAFKDPIGFVVIEALACQTPVVCSEGVGASDYLPKECVMKGFNAQEWVNAVKRVKL
jgi:glycosyltransferase involved in cell wall biosynthesis